MRLKSQSGFACSSDGRCVKRNAKAKAVQGGGSSLRGAKTYLMRNISQNGQRQPLKQEPRYKAN